MSLITNYYYRLLLTLFSGAIVLSIVSSTALAASVTLAWDMDDSDAVSGYSIYYGLKIGDNKENILQSNKKSISGGNIKECVIDNLEPGREYLFAAKSRDDSGRVSEYSDILTYRIPEQAGEEENTEPLPTPPVLSEPAKNAILYPGETIHLRAELYALPSEIFQGTSRWQIRRADQKNPLVYDESYPADLTDREITDANLFENGMKYAWRVGFQLADSDVYSWSEERFFVIGEKVLNDKTPPVSPGETMKDFKMVSFTHWTDDTCPKKTFSPFMKSEYHGKYRIATYDPAHNGDGGYREYSDFEVTPGRAYWILAKNGMNLSSEGVPVSTESDIFVPLEYNPSADNGWSMIAVPNDAVYAWGNVEFYVLNDEGGIVKGPISINSLSKDNPYMDTRIWEWKNNGAGKYEMHDSIDFKMEPHGGYWVRTKAKNITLIFPTHAQESDTLRSSAPNPINMISNWWHSGINWVGGKISPKPVYADLSASDDIKPPMPMNGLVNESSSNSGSGSSCFINTIFGNSK